MARTLLSGIIICLTFYCVISKAEKILGKETEDFDFDGFPGVTYEFKVEIKSGSEQCFYQKIAEGAILHVAYEVLRGGDRLIDIFIDNPYRNNVETQESRPEGMIEHKVQVTGVYTICLDNTKSIQRSFFVSKLVYFYLSTHVPEDWDKYLKEIEGVTSTVSNFTNTISSVQLSIEDVKQYQAFSRMNVIKDWYLVVGNNSYIMWWSVFQIVIVVFTSGFQVYCLRRFFRGTTNTAGSKTRA